jgi:transcriptional regulator with XRE-family HTH domain
MHVGKNISRIRELLGIKQEVLAVSLNVSQQTISKIEQSEKLGENTMERIANALGIKTSIILKYDERAIINFLQGAAPSSKPDFENFSETLHLVSKIIELYDRLILAEKEKFEIFSTSSKSGKNRKCA